MPMHARFPRTALAASLFLLPILLAGCAGSSTAPSSAAVPFIAGNWQFSSSAAAAAHLPAVSGALSGTSEAITGILHSQSASACVAPATPFVVSGSADKQGGVTLSGPLAGGTLTLTGTLAADGRSLSTASYNVAGGSCGFAKAADAMAQVYTPINGSYSGTFTDADGAVATIQASLSQSPSSTTSGDYTLTGTAGLPNNPCFSTASVTLTNTQVTGGTFTFSFTDPVTNATVTSNGSFAPDATTLTVQPWTLSNCSTDTGSGSLTKQ